ncbi:efflux RND transporter periplasmic adaptor subunit [Thermohalobacter berrensis]|uniref:Uncharacterized protein n=1 Tax=Thermohalobacter berrensis TaxID=99594 RepID=A0A419SZL8_9FIRM|nr:efflux RND transporter periplasmic adaptor subunit [Thermohalobacter berrensis]RKD30628.1 hypothetical protein BET03_04635 [Thermohalobacter berrensis]
MKKYIAIGLILVLLGVGAFIYKNYTSAVAVEVYEVEKGNIYEYIEETAIVKPREHRIITAKVGGEIVNINKEVGEKVKKGDILIELNTDEISLQIDKAKTKLEGLKASYKETIKPTKKEVINQAEAKVRSIEIKLEEAKRRAENNKKLYENDVISYEEYSSSVNALKQLEEELKIAKNELEILRNGVSSNIKKQHIAQIKGLEYDIEMLKKRKEDYLVKSPISGEILEVYLKEGDFVQPGTRFLEVGSTNNLYLQAEVLVDEIADISEGTEVLIVSDDLGIEAKGAVEKIYPKAFSRMSELGIEQKRVRVDILIKDKISDLRVGYELDVNFLINKKEDVLLLPQSAVFEDEGVNYVFVIENGKAKLREVEIGIEGDEEIEIISGLKMGEKVIVYPEKDIEEGLKVEEIKKENN